MTNNEHNSPVLDAPHPDTTILDEYGMTEPHDAEMDDWVALPVHSAADRLPMGDAELEALGETPKVATEPQPRTRSKSWCQCRGTSRREH